MEIYAQNLPTPSAEAKVDFDNVEFKVSFEKNWISIIMTDRGFTSNRVVCGFAKSSTELRKVAAAVNQIADFIEAD